MKNKVKQLKKAYESELDNINEQISYLNVERKMVEDVIDNLEDILSKKKSIHNPFIKCC